MTCPLAQPRLFLLALVASLVGGCAGYTLGDSGELPFRSVHVPPPVNISLAPQAAALVGTAVSREIDRSGRARIGSAESADARLQITLRDLRRDITADRADDTGLARKWRITLVAEITLADRRSGRTYIEKREVSAFDEAYSDSGHVAAEYQNMPLLAHRLAEAIAREVLAVW